MEFVDYAIIVVACVAAVMGFGILFLRKKKNNKIKAAFKETEETDEKIDMTGKDKEMEE